MALFHMLNCVHARIYSFISLAVIFFFPYSACFWSGAFCQYLGMVPIYSIIVSLDHSSCAIRTALTLLLMVQRRLLMKVCSQLYCSYLFVVWLVHLCVFTILTFIMHINQFLNIDFHMISCIKTCVCCNKESRICMFSQALLNSNCLML